MTVPVMFADSSGDGEGLTAGTTVGEAQAREKDQIGLQLI